MKRRILLCLATCLAMLLPAWGQTAGRDVYGWLRYDEMLPDVGICKFLTSNAENISVVHPQTDGLTACAGAFANGYYYLYLCKTDGYTETPYSFSRMDLNTGQMEQIADYQSMDVLFLDIELWKMTGIEAGSFIRNRLEDRRLQIVYISGKASYAWSLFKTQPLDFLVKPIRQEQVDEVLDLAVKILGRNETKFAYQSGRDYYYIPYGDIRYFVSEGRKIRIVTTQGEKEFYGKLRELEKTLPKDFLKIHQSYLVHTLFVARYAYEEVELTDGTILSISKKYRKQVRERLLRGGEEI